MHEITNMKEQTTSHGFELMKERSTVTECGHGVFGEPESYETINPDILAVETVSQCISLIDDLIADRNSKHQVGFSAEHTAGLIQARQTIQTYFFGVDGVDE